MSVCTNRTQLSAGAFTAAIVMVLIRIFSR